MKTAREDCFLVCFFFFHTILEELSKFSTPLFFIWSWIWKGENPNLQIDISGQKCRPLVLVLHMYCSLSKKKLQVWTKSNKWAVLILWVYPLHYTPYSEALVHINVWDWVRCKDIDWYLIAYISFPALSWIADQSHQVKYNGKMPTNKI